MSEFHHPNSRQKAVCAFAARPGARMKSERFSFFHYQESIQELGLGGAHPVYRLPSSSVFRMDS